MKKAILGLAVVALLSACGSEPGENETPAAISESAPQGEAQTAPGAGDDATELAASEDARPASAVQCVACHTFEKDGADGVGPNLWGAHGAPAASKPDYAYSTAMRESGFTWDDATLDAYLKNTRKALPGGKMSFGGIRDDAKRAELIAYLATLKDS